MRIFDLHCDTIYQCSKNGANINRNSLEISLSKAKNLDTWIQCFAFWIPDDYRGDRAYQIFLQQHMYLKDQIKRYPDSMSEYDMANPKSSCNAVLTVEGGAVLGGNIYNIRRLKEMGVSMMTLTWNAANEIAGGSECDRGFTQFGREVVLEMEQQGIIVDVSHLNSKSFWQLSQFSKKPFVATHSNSRRLCNHRRNLDDDQIAVLIERGGLMGLNFHEDFLSKKEAGIPDVIAHAEHVLKIGGEKILAIGSDFDGARMPKDLKNIEYLEKLHKSMVQYFGEKITDDIFYQNAYDFFLGLKPDTNRGLNL